MVYWEIMIKNYNDSFEIGIEEKHLGSCSFFGGNVSLQMKVVLYIAL